MSLRTWTPLRRSAVLPVQYALAKCLPGDRGPVAWLGTSFLPPTNVGHAKLFKPQLVRTVGLPRKQYPVVERFCFPRSFTCDFDRIKTMAIYTGSTTGFESGLDETDTVAHERDIGFTFSPAKDGMVYYFLAKTTGADGRPHRPTGDCAELQAVLAALGHRDWWREGWDRIVIITGSEYLGRGATQNMVKWTAEGWPSGCEGSPNRDLWEVLSSILGDYAGKGCEVSFWIKQVDRVQGV